MGLCSRPQPVTYCVVSLPWGISTYPVPQLSTRWCFADNLYCTWALPVSLHASSGKILSWINFFYFLLVPCPEFPIPAAKSRPIYGCKDIIAVKDFGRMPRHIWGKTGAGDGDLCRPWGITMSRFGRIIIADRSNNRIQVKCFSTSIY